MKDHQRSECFSDDVYSKCYTSTQLLRFFVCFLQNVLIDSTNFDKPLCPLCQRGFTYRKGVIEHIQILHGEHLVADLIGASDIADQKRLIDELQYK